MAYDRTVVSDAIDKLSRSIQLDAKATLVESVSKIVVDDNDDLSINAPAQVTAYVSSRRTARDSLLASAKIALSGL